MITDIRLQHFRSYDDSFFELDPAVNIIVGPNASGKTNLLEAVLVLARGSSYRANDSELVQFGADWARLDATTPTGQRTVKIKETGTKSYEIDGQKLTRLHAKKLLPVVLFEPDHLLLMSGSPDLRRIFMDDLIEQAELHFGPARRHYRRVLSQRNALLKKNPPDLKEQLFVWNLRLSELAGQIVRGRVALIKQFNESLAELYSSLAGHEHDIQLHYATRFNVETYETDLLGKLEHSLELDILRGFTAYGPHRDDMEVVIDGHLAQEVASRGEVRTTVLALKILELQMLEDRLNTRPILLLDDVFSELDAERREALTSYVSDHQTFITTTNADVAKQHFLASRVISTADQL